MHYQHSSSIFLPPSPSCSRAEVYNAEIIASPSSPWQRSGMYFKKKKKDQKPSKDYDFSEGSGWRGIWVTAGAGFSSSLSSVIPLTAPGAASGQGRAEESCHWHPWVPSRGSSCSGRCCLPLYEIAYCPCTLWERASSASSVFPPKIEVF